jgi:SPP1 family holin
MPMKITKSTIVRLILVALVIINFVLEKCGIDVIPTDEYTILMFVEAGIEIAILIVGVWKNNSVTQKAIKADEFLKELRESE